MATPSFIMRAVAPRTVAAEKTRANSPAVGGRRFSRIMLNSTGGPRPAARNFACCAAEPRVGVVIVDHGSKKKESNEMLEQFAEVFDLNSDFDIVESAHMEIAEPTILQASEKCIKRGATSVVIAPYFLSRGRHIQKDIPAIVHDAREAYPDVKFIVADPIGVDPLLAQLMQKRVFQALDPDA